MRAHAVWVIFRRELVDLLRDRRTVFSMVVLPMIAFPVITAVMAYFIDSAAKKAGEEATTVGVRSLEGLPEHMSEALKRSGLRTVVVPDLRKAIEDKRVAAAIEDKGGGAVIAVLTDRTRQSSEVAGTKLREALSQIREERIRARLRESGVAETVLHPFAVERVNTASERKMGGFLAGTMLGYVVILLMFSGGLYPAVDMTAGEKERKTMESLLASPAARTEIVLGKILATVSAIFVTALLTLASLFYSMKYGGFADAKNGAAMFLGNISIDGSTVGLLLLIVLPVALMAGALMIAIACYARSSKEAQSYLTPLLMLVILPSLLGGLPGMELSPTLAWIPIYNASQLMKGVLQGEFTALTFGITVLANLLYAGICFAIAVRIFRNEQVMFRT